MAVFIITLFMSFLLWIKFFDYIYLDTLVEHLTIGLGDVAPQIPLVGPLFPEKNPFNSAITLVSINKATEDKFGPLDPSWRKHHAVLVDRLSQAGAKVIMFDLTLGAAGESEFNQPFIDAIKRAKDSSKRARRKQMSLSDSKMLMKRQELLSLWKDSDKLSVAMESTCVGIEIGRIWKIGCISNQKKIPRSKASVFLPCP